MADKNVSSQVRLIPYKQLKDMDNRVTKYLNNPKNKNSPLKKVYLKNTLAGEYVTYERFKDMKIRAQRWKTTYGKWPDNVYILYPTPAKTNDCAKVTRYKESDVKQQTNYFCGPNIAQQIIYDLTGKFYDEHALAKKFGTLNPSGTTPERMQKGIVDMLKGLGHKSAKLQFMSLKTAGGWSKLAEIMKDPKKSFGIYNKYKEQFWHYEFPVEICVKDKQVVIANSLSGGWIEKRAMSRLEKEMSYTYDRAVLLVTI